MRIWERLKAYRANDDPRAAACGSIALVVAWNQPFYPLYLHWFVGGDAWLGCVTFLSTPFFIATPWVARRSSRVGRAWLPLTGLANTALSSWAFGEASGVAWFVIPCALIAAFAFRRAEWRSATALIFLAAATPFALHALHLAPLGTYSTSDYGRFLRMNVYSVVTLVLVVAWTFRGALGGQATARVTR